MLINIEYIITNMSQYFRVYDLKASSANFTGIVATNAGITSNTVGITANAGITGNNFPITANAGITSNTVGITANAGITGNNFPITANAGIRSNTVGITANAGITGNNSPITANAGITANNSPIIANAGLNVIAGDTTFNARPTVAEVEVALITDINSGGPDVFCKVASDGSLQAGSQGVSGVERIGAGQYKILLSSNLPEGAKIITTCFGDNPYNFSSKVRIINTTYIVITCGFEDGDTRFQDQGIFVCIFY